MIGGPQQPQGVLPQPVPTAVNLGQVQGPQGMLVMLQISHPSGVSIFFLDPAAARQVGEQLVQLGGASNLLIAGPGQVPA